MHDFVGVDNVISKERLSEISRRANGPAFRRLAEHFGAIGLNTVAMAWTWGTWWCIPFFMLQGKGCCLISCTPPSMSVTTSPPLKAAG